jgi:mRNA-degrading endonuclease toxin of MazEF toxin-antitoxin module
VPQLSRSLLRAARIVAPARAVAGRVVGRVVRSVNTRFRGGAVPRPPDCGIRRVERVDVTLTYEPHPDGKPDPGEVVWLWLPYEEDATIGKDRPGVVIGWVVDVYERAGSREIAIVPLTSKVRAGQIAIGLGNWDGSRRRSYAKVDQVYAVEREFVRREGASLPKSSFDQLVNALD